MTTTNERTFRRAERISSRSSLEEEQREEDEDFGPDTRTVRVSVDTKGFKGGEEDEDGRPAVVQGEGEMDEDCSRRIDVSIGRRR